MLILYLLLWMFYHVFFYCCTHNAKNNLKLCMKTEPVTVGADATVYVWFLGQIFSMWAKPGHVYYAASAPAVTVAPFSCRDLDYFQPSVLLNSLTLKTGSLCNTVKSSVLQRTPPTRAHTDSTILINRRRGAAAAPWWGGNSGFESFIYYTEKFLKTDRLTVQNWLLPQT